MSLHTYRAFIAAVTDFIRVLLPCELLWFPADESMDDRPDRPVCDICVYMHEAFDVEGPRFEKPRWQKFGCKVNEIIANLGLTVL